MAALIALLCFGATAIALRVLRPLPAGTITARLLNPSGKPVRCNATLWEVREDGGRALASDSSQRCDKDGRLTWTGLAAGKWRLMALAEDCEMLDREMELAVDRGTDLGDVPLVWGGLLVGTVSEDGQPAAGVEVRSSRGRSVTTRQNGQYKLDGLPIGEVEVRAARGFSGGGGKTTITRGGHSTLDIELVPVPPRGVLGFTLDAADGVLKVATITPGSPAEGQLQPGDVLEEVDGSPVGDDIARARKLVAGEPGAPVRLTVRRGGAALPLELTRVSARDL